MHVYLHKITPHFPAMDDITDFRDYKVKLISKEDAEEEEEEETLSLRDFPLNSDKKDSFSKSSHNNRRSCSEPADFFEFFNEVSSEMSHAEDIIFCGKLVPYTNVHRRRVLNKSLSEHNHAADSSARYRDSSPRQLKPHAIKTKRPTTPRNRSLERRGPKPPDIHRSYSKSSAKSEGSKASKSRWFVLMFGPLKLQQEMDLRDMKNRQVRRNPGSMFPGMDAGGKIAANRTDRSSSWGLDFLRVLSCKSHASVAVTASIGLVPHF